MQEQQELLEDHVSPPRPNCGKNCLFYGMYWLWGVSVPA